MALHATCILSVLIISGRLAGLFVTKSFGGQCVYINQTAIFPSELNNIYYGGMDNSTLYNVPPYG